MSQKIRIKLKSYDHALVDKAADKIVKSVKATGAVVNGPIPLPTDKKIFTVNRATFVNKKARFTQILAGLPKTLSVGLKNARAKCAVSRRCGPCRSSRRGPRSSQEANSRALKLKF